jgi:hypothetical protein
MAEVTDTPRFFEIVRPVAKHLIGAVKSFGDLMAWEDPGSRGEEASPSIGAAHGAAGIAMALAVWGRATSDHVVQGLARDVLLGLYQAGRSVDGRRLRYTVDVRSKSAPRGAWCHGSAGYLWCLLAAFGDDPSLSECIDWAVGSFAESEIIHSPTYCHGLAGQLELSRMLRMIPRHRAFGDQRSAQVTAALRLLQQRRDGLILWSSEDPDVATPDLWVGFLGPAAALAMSTLSNGGSLFAGSWLRRCADFMAKN